MKKIFTLFFLCYTSLLCAQQQQSVVNNPVKTDTTVFTKVEVEAEFSGGEVAWNEYVRISIEKNLKKIMRNKPSVGTCEVQFIIDRDGSAINVEALTMKNTTLAEVFTNAIKKGPKWKPATINGKPVKAWRRQKVTFEPPVD
jgi:periplasmic protein TonB